MIGLTPRGRTLMSHDGGSKGEIELYFTPKIDNTFDLWLVSDQSGVLHIIDDIHRDSIKDLCDMLSEMLREQAEVTNFWRKQ